MLASVKPANHIEPVFFGLNPDLAYYADEIENLGLKGTAARFHTPDSEFRAHISIPGAHMVYNALAAIAVGRVMGMNDKEIRQGIESLAPLAGRNHLIETETLTIIDDCYNANPASMKASLDVLSKAGGRTVAILGDMFELGPKEHEMHRETGAFAADAGIDELICIGSLAEDIARGAMEVNPEMHVHYYETKTEFLENIDPLINTNDTILVKASHAMEFPEIVEVLKKR